MQDVAASTRHAEIEAAAHEGAQIGALDSAAAAAEHDTRHHDEAETALPTRTQTSEGSQTASDLDEKSDTHPATPTTNKDAKDAKGSGHWLQQDKQVLPYNNMKIVMPGICLIIFLAALDQTIVSTALPVISQRLDGDAGQYSWVGSAYLLASTSLIPLYGRLSDLTGRKPLLYIATAIFLLGSALCGAAQNMAWLDAARGVQGIGGGGIIALINIIIGDIVSLEDRGKYSGWIGGVWGVASVIGPLLGGAFTDAGHSGWRWCFFVNLPLGAIALAIIFFSLNLNPRPKLTFREACGEFDFIGLVMVVVSVVLILLGFNYAETKSWKRPETISLLTVGGCAAGGVHGVGVQDDQEADCAAASGDDAHHLAHPALGGAARFRLLRSHLLPARLLPGDLRRVGAHERCLHAAVCAHRLDPLQCGRIRHLQVPRLQAVPLGRLGHHAHRLQPHGHARCGYEHGQAGGIHRHRWSRHGLPLPDAPRRVDGRHAARRPLDYGGSHVARAFARRHHGHRCSRRSVQHPEPLEARKDSWLHHGHGLDGLGRTGPHRTAQHPAARTQPPDHPRLCQRPSRRVDRACAHGGGGLPRRPRRQGLLAPQGCQAEPAGGQEEGRRPREPRNRIHAGRRCRAQANLDG
ncbi:hypothetical protein L1887_61959 [Cichorium endivia]|nr:hypothetical protein L1887_61959 [Cichorium endivia]